MNNNKTDLSKAIDMVSKIFTILIPFVLFYFGNELKKAQDADNKEQQNYNRITTLLKSLSSENTLEKKLAVKFSQDLANAGNFPTELLSVINEVSATDSSLSKAAGAVLDTLHQKAIAENNISAEQHIKQVAANSPTKVYMQIPKGYNIDSANHLLTDLKKQGYNMLGIERMDLTKSPQNTEVRYFKKSDYSQATNLAAGINKTGNFAAQIKYIQGYENKIAGSQLEIWLK